MKLRTISYGRTFAYNYQSYRADIQVELESWETDLDVCFDNLRQMVNDQIGRQCEEFTEADSLEIAPLRAHLQFLQKECRRIESNMRTLTNVRDELINYQIRPIIEMLNDLERLAFNFDIPKDKYIQILEIRDKMVEHSKREFKDDWDPMPF